MVRLLHAIAVGFIVGLACLFLAAVVVGILDYARGGFGPRLPG